MAAINRPNSCAEQLAIPSKIQNMNTPQNMDGTWKHYAKERSWPPMKFAELTDGITESGRGVLRGWGESGK